jgi:23S rRNA (guanosine2251-2'-O)-methyltransferase
MKRILAGPNAVTEALEASPGTVNVVYTASGLKPVTAKRIAELGARGKVRHEELPREALDGLAGDLNHQGVVAITGDYPYLDLDGLLARARAVSDPVIVVLDQIQDPGNLGAIVRSAHALGAAGVVLTRDRSAGVTAAAVRASAGASERIAIARVTNLVRAIDDLKAAGYRVLGAAGEAAAPLSRMDWSGPIALVLGNEGRGLRRLTRESCDLLFRIPMPSSFDSLNVSAAAAIAIYEATGSRIG